MDISNSITSVIDSKVHAMNVLRMIFKNKEFTEIIDIYIERSIMLAIIGVGSPFWKASLNNILLYYIFKVLLL